MKIRTINFFFLVIAGEVGWGAMVSTPSTLRVKNSSTKGLLVSKVSQMIFRSSILRIGFFKLKKVHEFFTSL